MKYVAAQEKEIPEKKDLNLFFRSSHGSTEHQLSDEPELPQHVGVSLGPPDAGDPPGHHILPPHRDRVNHQAEKKQPEQNNNQLPHKTIATVSFQGT